MVQYSFHISTSDTWLGEPPENKSKSFCVCLTLLILVILFYDSYRFERTSKLEILKALYCKSHKHQGYNVHGYKNVSVRENNNNLAKKRIVCRQKILFFSRPDRILV